MPLRKGLEGTVDAPDPEKRPPARGTFARAGVLELTGLEPGTYFLHVNHFGPAGILMGSVEVAVVAGATSDVVLALLIQRR